MSRAVVVIALMAVVMWFAVTMLPGCAAAPESRHADVKPIYAAEGEARSLITDTPGMRRSPELAGHYGIDPWYVDRNDHRPAVVAGYESPTLRSTYTRTYDRLHATPYGHVHDHYHRTTYRMRYTEGVQ